MIDKSTSRRIRVQIRHVLLEVWDPIGVRDEPNAQDEYDGYIGPVFELLVHDGTDAQIVDHLHWAEERMGMNGSRHNDQDVVTALRAIRLTD